MGAFDGVLHEHPSEESERGALGHHPLVVHVACAAMFV